MKKYLIIIAVCGALMSCRSNADKSNAMIVDSLNRASLDKSQVVEMNGVSDTLIGSNGATYVKVDPNRPATVVTTPAPVTPVRRSNTVRSSSTTTTTTTQGTTTTQTTKKKGWSSAAKGTVIGAASGAVLGAIVDKKHGRGAVIGGLIGAGGGYLIGHKKDKKRAQQ